MLTFSASSLRMDTLCNAATSTMPGGTCWNGGAAADDASNAALVTHLNRRAARNSIALSHDTSSQQ